MVGKRHSVADLFKAYAAQKASEEWRGEWAIMLFYRPLAVVLAAILLRLRVGAPAVTLFSLAIVISLLVIAFWGGSYWAVGLLAMLVITLDCVGGTIARATGAMSNFGHYLDFATAVFFRIAQYAAIGLIAGRDPAMPEGRALGLAILAAGFAVAARLCRVYAEPLAGLEVCREESGQWYGTGTAAFLFSAPSGIDPLTPLLVIIAGAWHALDWLVMWLLFCSALDFVVTQVAILRRLQ